MPWHQTSYTEAPLCATCDLAATEYATPFKWNPAKNVEA